MTIPAFVIGGLLASIFGLLFHLWRGGGLGRLVYYLIISWLGFWLGQYIGLRLDINFIQIGPLYAGSATIMCIVILFFGHWLSLIEVSSKKVK